MVAIRTEITIRFVFANTAPEYHQALDVRPWIREGGGVLATDSPRLSAQMIDIFRKAGLPQLVEGYLGEPPLISLQKTTLAELIEFDARPAHTPSTITVTS